MTEANIVACVAVGDSIASLLGPRSAAMLFVDDGEVLCTNDGATALRLMRIEHPVAQLLVQLSQSIDAEIGDGTTSVTLLAATLLRECLPLVRDRVPRPALERALTLAAELLADLAPALARDISSLRPDEPLLLRTVETTLHGDAVLAAAVAGARLHAPSSDGVHVLSVPGVGPPHWRAALLLPWQDTLPGRDRTVRGRVCVLELPASPAAIHVAATQVDAALRAMESQQRTLVATLVRGGVRVLLLTRPLLAGDVPPMLRHFLQRGGVVLCVLSRAEAERAARALGTAMLTGAEQVAAALPHLPTVDAAVQALGEREYLEIAPSRDATLVLRGGSEATLEEAGRAVRDGLGVLDALIRDPRVVPGGGAVEFAAAATLERCAAALLRFAADAPSTAAAAGSELHQTAPVLNAEAAEPAAMATAAQAAQVVQVPGTNRAPSLPDPPLATVPAAEAAVRRRLQHWLSMGVRLAADHVLCARVLRAVAAALLRIPLTLAQHAALPAEHCLRALRQRPVGSGVHTLLDEPEPLEALAGKLAQHALALEAARAVLRIDAVLL